MRDVTNSQAFIRGASTAQRVTAGLRYAGRDTGDRAPAVSRGCCTPREVAATTLKEATRCGT